MSMSTRVVGFVPPDDDWRKMRDVWQACKAAGIAVPTVVEMFFDDGEPDPQGQEVELPSQEWTNGDMCQGIEIDVAKIPSRVKTIRFYNCW